MIEIETYSLDDNHFLIIRVCSMYVSLNLISYNGFPLLLKVILYTCIYSFDIKLISFEDISSRIQRFPEITSKQTNQRKILNPANPEGNRNPARSNLATKLLYIYIDSSTVQH